MKDVIIQNISKIFFLRKLKGIIQKLIPFVDVGMDPLENERINEEHSINIVLF